MRRPSTLKAIRLIRFTLVRTLVGIAVGALGLAVLGVLGASVILQGSRLGRLIQGSLPENRGKLEIGGVTWRLRALTDLITDAPSPITLDGLRIVDPEGTVVLDVPHLEARVRLRTLIKGSIAIHDLRIPKASWRFARMNQEDKIGFLSALAPKHPEPPPPATAEGQRAKERQKEGPGSYFQIVNAELGDFTAVFDFPGTWGLELRHTHLAASLLQSTVDPKHPIFRFDVTSVVAEEGGRLRIFDDNVLPFDRIAITRVATLPDHPDDIFLDLAGADAGHSRLIGKGFFTGIFSETAAAGIDLHAEISDAADMLAAAVAAKKIEGLSISGSGASVRLDLKQPFEKMKVAGAFRGLDVQYADYRALGVGFDLDFDGGAGLVGVNQFGFGAPGGGRLDMDARLEIAGTRLALDARLRDLHTESYLPPNLRALGAGTISGQIQAKGNLAAKSVHVQKVDLRLDRAHRAGLPRRLRVHGEARLSQGEVGTSGLTVEVPGASATVKGALDLERQRIQASLSVLASDLGRVLGDLGLPPLAKDARADVTLGGTIAAPSADGHATIHGLGAEGRVLPELTARFSLKDGAARIDSLAGAAFGGSLRAKGELRLYEKTTRHMLKSPIVDLQIAGRDLDVSAMAGTKAVAGRLSFDGRAQGALDAVTAEIDVPAGSALRVLDDDYELGPVEIGLDANQVALKKLHLARRRGGTLDVHGTMAVAHKKDVAMDVVLTRFPLGGIPGLAEAAIPISGYVGAKLHVSGKPELPGVEGTVDLTEVLARGVKLGDGHLVVGPDTSSGAAAGTFALTGQLFDRFRFAGRAAMGDAGPRVHGAMTFDRLALEELAPEIGGLGDGRGIATGQITVDIDPGRPLTVDVLLRELSLSIAREVEGASGETTVQRVHVQASRPVHAAMKGSEVTLDEALFATDGGDLRARGRIDLAGARGAGVLEGEMQGHLDLEILQPFLRTSMERMSGDLKVELAAAGTLDRPLLHGRVEVADAIKIRPRGFESDITLGSGSFQLNQDEVEVEGVALTVEGSTVRLSGRAGLGPGFQPQKIHADLDGDVSARLLAYVTPDAVSDTRGTARIHATVAGTLAKPVISGRLDLGTIDFRARDLGSEVQIQSGVVEISNAGAVLHDVVVHLDDGGVLVIGASGVRAGQVAFTALAPFQLGQVDLPLHGERLTYRSPETFEVDDLAFDLNLRGNVDHGFAVGGEVRLVSGRYLQDFKMQNLVLSPRVNESSVRPFYEGKPLLAGLRLDLGVRTVGDGFVVQNNLAPEIHVDIVLNVGGTLAAPTLAGDVRPTDGRFHFPAIRGDFDLAGVNHVTFIATKSVADGDTPELNIEAQNLVTDVNGTDHTVRVHIHGPIREAQIDLSTDDGLDRTQTALLLVTGRSPADTQRFATQNPTVGANLGTAADVADQLARDTVANLMEPYITDNFERVTGLVLRPSIGPNGFEVRVSKNISRYLIFRAETLLGFQNLSRQRLQLDLWLMDYVRLGGGIERITLSSQQGVNETLPLNGNLELRWDFAIRR